MKSIPAPTEPNAADQTSPPDEPTYVWPRAVARAIAAVLIDAAQKAQEYQQAPLPAPDAPAKAKRSAKLAPTKARRKR